MSQTPQEIRLVFDKIREDIDRDLLLAIGKAVLPPEEYDSYVKKHVENADWALNETRNCD